MPHSPKTTKALRQATLESLLATGPEHFDMDYWGRKPTTWEGGVISYQLERMIGSAGPDMTQCGTAACFAGHGMMAAKMLHLAGDGDNPIEWIRDQLDVPEWMFYRNRWRGMVKQTAELTSDWATAAAVLRWLLDGERTYMSLVDYSVEDQTVLERYALEAEETVRR